MNLHHYISYTKIIFYRALKDTIGFSELTFGKILFGVLTVVFGLTAHYLWAGVVEAKSEFIALIAYSVIGFICGCIITFLYYLITSLAKIYFDQKKQIFELVDQIKSKKSQAEVIRGKIKIELDNNLEKLQNIWQGLDEERVAQQNAGHISITLQIGLANKFIQMRMPSWDQDAWKEYKRSSSSDVLSEEENNFVSRFYTQLNDISAIHAKMNGYFRDQLEGKGQQMGVPGRFDEMAPKLWSEVEEMILLVIAQGNIL